MQKSAECQERERVTALSLLISPKTLLTVPCGLLVLHPLGNSKNSQMSHLTHAESQPWAVSVDPGTTVPLKLPLKLEGARIL